jgi:hypothetical protein
MNRRDARTRRRSITDPEGQNEVGAGDARELRVMEL